MTRTMTPIEQVREALEELKRDIDNTGGIWEYSSDNFKAKVDAALAILKDMEGQEPVAAHDGFGSPMDVERYEGEVWNEEHRPAHPSPSTPVELSEGDMRRIAREVVPPDTTNDGEPWYSHRQADQNLGASMAIRHITKHYTLHRKP